MKTDTSITAERKETLEKELERIVGILVREYEPEKIILFGSLATGEIYEWSDIDLLIVKKTRQKPLDRTARVMKILNYPRIAMDIFVYTSSEIEYLLKEGSPFMKEIFEEGKVLHEKDN